MTEKTLDQIIDELPSRKLYLGGEDDSIPPTYRKTDVYQLAEIDFFIIEIDPSPDGVVAHSWWPAGMVGDEMERGPAMDPKLMILEARMLLAVNGGFRALVTMDPTLEWDPTWAELVADA